MTCFTAGWWLLKKWHLLHSLSFPSCKCRCFQNSRRNGVTRQKEPGPLGHCMEEYCLLTRHPLDKVFSVLGHENLGPSFLSHVKYFLTLVSGPSLGYFIWLLSMVISLGSMTPFNIQQETNRGIEDGLFYDKHSKA